MGNPEKRVRRAPPRLSPGAPAKSSGNYRENHWEFAKIAAVVALPYPCI